MSVSLNYLFYDNRVAGTTDLSNFNIKQHAHEMQLWKHNKKQNKSYLLTTIE